MKQSTIGVVMWLLMGVLLVGSTSVSAEESQFHPFVLDEYYLGNPDGTPLESLGDITREHFRSDEAFLKFKGEFEKKLELTKTEEEFFALLADESMVRATTPCTGRIHTSGISDEGETNDFERDCYKGEILIELLVDDDWELLGSLGCLNPSWLHIVTAVPEPAEPPVELKDEPKRRLTVVGSRAVGGPLTIQETVHVHTCECGHIECGVKTVIQGRVIINNQPASGTREPAFSLGN